MMNDDGTMARVPDLVPYCEKHDLKMVTVAELIAYRRRTEKLVERVVATALPTSFGDFTAVGYRSLVDDKHHVAMVKGDVDGADDVLVRVHSECLTGDVFHSMRCDCGDQLAAALAMIEEEGQGCAPLPLARGSGHWPAEQAARLQTAGGGGRHGRGQPQTGAAGGPARLRHRRPDPRRSRPDQHPHPHQQPEKDRRLGGVRALGLRAGADRGQPQHPQRGLPARQARQDGPLAAPPGPGPRRGDDPRRGGARGGEGRGPMAEAGPFLEEFGEDEKAALSGLEFAVFVGRFYEDLADRLLAGRAARGSRSPGLHHPPSASSRCRGPTSCRLLPSPLSRARSRGAHHRTAAHRRGASPVSASSSAARPTTTTSSAPRPPVGSRMSSWKPACPAPSA